MVRETIRVLLIGDNPNVAGVVQQLLMECGDHGSGNAIYTLECRERIEDGLADQAKGHWDVILFELSLPDRQQLNSIRQVIQESPRIPIVVLSSLNDEEQALAAIREGAQDCLPCGQLDGHGLIRSIRYALERKKAEEVLRERTKEVIAVLENAPMAIFLIDQTRRIRKCNRASLELSGLRRGELEQLFVGDLLRCRFRSAITGQCGGAAHCLQCLIGRILSETLDLGVSHRRLEARYLPDDGENGDERVLMLSSTPLVFGEERMSLMCIEEITASKHAEREAREGLHFLQTLIDSIPTPIFFKDVNRVYRGCNASFSTITGLGKEAIVGKDVHAIWEEPVARRFDSVDNELLRQPGKVVYEDQIPMADGSTHDFFCQKATYADSEGNVSGIVGVMMDISERKRAEEERNQLAKAIEQAAESIVITDRDGSIRYVNPAFQSVTGYTREEILGQNPRILKSGKHDESFYREMWGSLLQGRVWRGRMFNRKKDGVLLEENVSISPIRSNSGEIVSFVAVKRDVTNEIRLERQLRQAQKLEAIGTLAGGIAHDFNNILGAILGFTELCLMDELSDSVREQLQHVLLGGGRAKDLVKQILAFSRQGEEERKPIFLSPIIKEVSKLLRASLPSIIEIRQAIESDNGSMVMADPTQIHQILMNLSTNAAHAMRQTGGILHISLDRVDPDPLSAETMKDSPVGPCLRLRVSDTGHGMNREVLERIFDPYFTTKGPGEGTGLGLAVVHGIVKSHMGQISVHSEPGGGTQFQIDFPVIDSPAPVVELESTTLQNRGRGEHILIVDDETAILDVQTRMLNRMGYKVTARSCGIEALELFKADPDGFQAVIADQTMPQMTGLVLAGKLIRMRPDLPIILCTGFSEQVDAARAESHGIKEFLLKPVVYRELADAVQRSLSGGADSGMVQSDLASCEMC